MATTDPYNETIQRLRSSAERIRSGKGDKPRPDRAKPDMGIMKRFQKEQAAYDKEKAARKSDPAVTMLDYYSKLDELKASRNPTEPHADTPASTLIPTKNGAYVAREAIARIESSDNYEALGKVIDNPESMYHGDRAYGRYQVMGRNIADWSKQALGKAVSKEEFLASPAIQDAVVEWKLALEKEKHGTWEDAAAVWFSGNPVEGNNAPDVTSGIRVPKYLENFRGAWNKIAGELLDTVDVSPEAEADDQRGLMRKRI